MPEDTRYRDMCISGAPLSQTAFNPYTGLPLAQDVHGLGWEYWAAYFDPDFGVGDSLTAFDEAFVGRVNGVKPALGTCIPIKDTAKVDVTAYRYDEDLAFTYYLNMDDRDQTIHQSLLSTGGASVQDIYGGSNYYMAKSFFIGGNNGCPDILEYKDPYKPKLDDSASVAIRADFRRFQAENCYDLYIMQHMTNPMSAMEMPDGGTDDPLSVFDPMRTFLNSCQPLINGQDANNIKTRGWMQRADPSYLEKKSGFSPVLRYPGRPDADEAEYLISWYLQKGWDRNFVNNTKDYRFQLKSNVNMVNPFDSISVNLPCIVEAGSGYPPITAYPNPPEPQPQPPSCTPDSEPEPTYYVDEACRPPYFRPPEDKYYSPPAHTQFYCPNVEKVSEPGHPFSPRHDITGVDRDYSWRTSVCVYDPGPCGSDRWYRGYTSFQPYDCEDGDPITWSFWWNDNEGTRSSVNTAAYPPVMCAVVPVDILSFRAEAFDTCMMQRINYNFNQWVAEGFPDADFFWPPCATRFYEYDDVGTGHLMDGTDIENGDVRGTGCPAKMSIQQCCRIIVKDVVPANMLKLRTEEGLKDTRVDLSKIGWFDWPGTEVYVDWEENFADAIVNINDRSYGGINIHTYRAALMDNQTLNEIQGYGTEPAAYRFKSYFQAFSAPDLDNSIDGGVTYPWKFVGYNMPYMRWWDTGVSAGNIYHGGSFLNTLGGFDTLIGVGREERDKSQSWYWYQTGMSMSRDTGWQQMNPYDQGTRLSSQQPAEMGRVGGWAELKAHQMWSIRKSNLFCIGRYEKLFKPTGPEDFVLSKAGAGFTTQTGQQYSWPLGWRGYITDTTFNYPLSFYPNVPDDPNKNWYGLDNALPGDIVVYYINNTDRMPRIGYVVDIGFDDEGSDPANFNFALEKYVRGGRVMVPTRVNVVTWDQNKFPTSTGMSIGAGMGPIRTIYKYGVPDYDRQKICDYYLRALTDVEPGVFSCRSGFDIGQCMASLCHPSCEEPNYQSCVLEPDDGGRKLGWQRAWIYRPSRDNEILRCDAEITQTGANGTTLSQYQWDRTYNWTGIDLNNPMRPPVPDFRVVYQQDSMLVDSNVWAYCVNGGFDPPTHWAKDYKGPQTGTVTDTTICGPAWYDCGTASQHIWLSPGLWLR